MLSKHLPIQHSANLKKTLSWCAISTSSPYSHTPTQHDSRTQKKHAFINYKLPKIERFKPQMVALKQLSSCTSTERHFYYLTNSTSSWEWHTFTHQQTTKTTPTSPLKWPSTHEESTPTAHYSFQTLPNKTGLPSSHTAEHITLDTHMPSLHKQNNRDLSCKHHTRHHTPTPHQHTSQITPPPRRPSPNVTVSSSAPHRNPNLRGQNWLSPNQNRPHCNSAEGVTEHLLLLYSAQLVHRGLHHTYALEHL